MLCIDIRNHSGIDVLDIYVMAVPGFERKPNLLFYELLENDAHVHDNLQVTTCQGKKTKTYAHK